MPLKDITVNTFASSKLKDVPSNVKGNDRSLVLRPIPGGPGTNSKGLVDSRLFTGGNTLHVILDEQLGLWYLKYDSGKVPGSFEQHFTSFSKALAFVTEYYKKRNIEITEVID
jgi:hypothetical protein